MLLATILQCRKSPMYVFQFVVSTVAGLSLGAPPEPPQTTPVQIISQNSVVNADGSFNYR